MEKNSTKGSPCNYQEQSFCFGEEGQRIGGMLFLPQSTEGERLPLTICCHGLGAGWQSISRYARHLAECGRASCCFDFRGGGGSASDGSMLEMSLMSELTDASLVLEEALSWDFVDTSRISFLGESQGGAVASLVAARHPKVVEKLVLLYPAFVIPDAMHALFSTKKDIPNEYNIVWVHVGRAYAEDVWDCDIFKEIASFEKPVLLMHGKEDAIVPVDYSRRAAEVYKQVNYLEFEGAGHGFSGSTYTHALERIVAFLD